MRILRRKDHPRGFQRYHQVRWLARLCAGLAFLVCGYLLAAVLGAVVPGRTADLPAGADVEIVLIAGPIHYDILLPLDAQTRAAFGFVADAGVPRLRRAMRR